MKSKLRKSLSMLISLSMILAMFPIGALAVTPLTGVTIEGTAKVGEELTAVVAPEEATATYKWQSAATVDGVYTDIDDATESAYTLAETDLGKFIKVVVTGTGEYSGELTSEATAAVAAADPVATPLTGVTIEGTAKVGEELTAVVAPEEATATYKWQSAVAVDGVYTDIDDATESAYTLAETDLGKFIKVVVTGTGEYSGELTSEATAAVAAADLDYTALTTAISDAQTAKIGVLVSTDGSDVVIGTKWVTQTVLETLNNAIATAQAMVEDDTATNQSDVTNAVAALNGAVGTFNDAKADGTWNISITSISDETSGGAGLTRNITTTGTTGAQYLVIQITEGTGVNAKVSVVMVEAADTVTVSYKTTAHVQVWLTDGMPVLSGSGATGATIYHTLPSAN